MAQISMLFYVIKEHRLIGKRVVDFLLVIIELFSLAVKLVELRANRLESVVLEGVGSL